MFARRRSFCFFPRTSNGNRVAGHPWPMGGTRGFNPFSGLGWVENSGLGWVSWNIPVKFLRAGLILG
jgi:hypothetical protein